MSGRSWNAGLVRCLAAAVLFGASAPAASRLADDLSPFTLAGLLYLGAALAVAPVVARRPPAPGALRRSVRPLTTAVVLGGAVGPVLLAAGLARVPAATASLLLNLELVFTVAVAALFFREHIGRHVWTGSALVVIGSLVVGWRGAPDVRWGAVLIAGACLCWAFDNSVTAGLDQLSPSHITMVKGAVAGSTNLLIGLIADGAPGPGPVLWALAIGAVGYGASITLWVAGARDLGAARGQLVFSTAPFVGAVLAWTVLGDTATAAQLVAFALGAAGVGLVMRSSHEHDHVHTAQTHEHEHRHDDGHHDHRHDPPVTGRHTHEHHHEPVAHRHPHVPDLHHRHDH